MVEKFGEKKEEMKDNKGKGKLDEGGAGKKRRGRECSSTCPVG